MAGFGDPKNKKKSAAFERFRNDQETEEDCNDFEDVIFVNNLFAIRLDENKCCQIPIT